MNSYDLNWNRSTKIENRLLDMWQEQREGQQYCWSDIGYSQKFDPTLLNLFATELTAMENDRLKALRGE